MSKARQLSHGSICEHLSAAGGVVNLDNHRCMLPRSQSTVDCEVLLRHPTHSELALEGITDLAAIKRAQLRYRLSGVRVALD